jgi:cytidylate kinase
VSGWATGARRHLLIAIDGPAGSGKSTLARALSREFDLPYINTGIMYRALTLRALEEGVDPGDGSALTALLEQMVFAVGGPPPGELFVDDAEPGAMLVSETVEANVSAVAAVPEVRHLMRELQRNLGSEGAVMEGRDICTVVFPDADVKFFLVASPAERAARRSEERGGGEDLGADLETRDALDATVNPLIPAEGAVVIDNTSRGPAEVLAEAVSTVRARVGERE